MLLFTTIIISDEGLCWRHFILHKSHERVGKYSAAYACEKKKRKKKAFFDVYVHHYGCSLVVCSIYN